MPINLNQELTEEQKQEILKALKVRFDSNMHRHPDINWEKLQAKLEATPEATPSKLRSLYAMESTGGEPDVVKCDDTTNEYVFCDCSAETPKGRRSLCYDREAFDTRKEFKPENSALDVAAEMGVELLDEEQYRELQQFGKFDAKTSSWLKTPSDIRRLGGAIFAEFRYGHVFVFHNGAQSYYAVRGFRGLLRV